MSGQHQQHAGPQTVHRTVPWCRRLARHSDRANVQTAVSDQQSLAAQQ